MNRARRIAACLPPLLLCGCLPLAPRTVYVPADAPLGPYSGSVLCGYECFVSGKIGTSNRDFRQEARSAIDAVEEELKRAGLTLADVVSVTVYLTDMNQYPALNEVYAERFPEPYPARTVVEVTALPAAAQLEIQVIARRK